MRKIGCLERLRELGDLPNLDGFRFVGVKKDGTEVSGVVRKDDKGLYRAYDEKTGEWIFSDLKGWRVA